MKTEYISFLFVLLLFSLVACARQPASSMETKTLEQTDTAITAPSAESRWKDAEFTDVKTGNTFKISDFAGKTVLVESFAVWCPKCLQQQQEMKKFQAENPDVILVSLDTDPNENTGKVQEHLARNKFNWLFAVSPAEVTRSLINEFGLSVVHAPSSPVILVCPDQSAQLLPGGQKSVKELKEEMERC